MATATIRSEPCGPPTFGSPAPKSVLKILSNRDDMVLRRVCQIHACGKLLSSDARCLRGRCESFVRRCENSESQFGLCQCGRQCAELSRSRRAVILGRLQLHWERATKAIHQIPRSKTPLSSWGVCNFTGRGQQRPYTRSPAARPLRHQARDHFVVIDIVATATLREKTACREIPVGYVAMKRSTSCSPRRCSRPVSPCGLTTSGTALVSHPAVYKGRDCRRSGTSSRTTDIVNVIIIRLGTERVG